MQNNEIVDNVNADHTQRATIRSIQLPDSRHSKIQIPVELIKYVNQNNLIKPFSLYIGLKLISDGKIHKNSPAIKIVRRVLRMNDNRTFRKHVEELQRLQWIGFNPKSELYFIRGTSQLRTLHKWKRQTAATFCPKDLPQVQIFSAAVIISAHINAIKFVREFRNGRRQRAATKNSDVAKQPNVFPYVPDYYGCSGKRIAQLLGCEPTRASVLKNEAAKADYIKVKKKFALLYKLTTADYKLRSCLEESDPKLAGKIRVKRVTVNGVEEFHFMRQLHDEITPLIKFKTVRAKK